MRAFNFLERYLHDAGNGFSGVRGYINNALYTARRNVVNVGLPLVLTGFFLLLASSGVGVATPTSTPTAASKPAPTATPVPPSVLTYRGRDSCSLYNLFLTKFSRSPNSNPTRERRDIINMDFLALRVDDKIGVVYSTGESCGLRDNVPLDLDLYAEWNGGEGSIWFSYPSHMPNFQSQEVRGNVEVPTDAREVKITRKKLTRVGDTGYLEDRGIPREEQSQTLNGLTPTSKEQLVTSVYDILRSRIIDDSFFARYEPRAPVNIINQAVSYSGDSVSITLYLKNTSKTDDVDLRGMSFRPSYALDEDGKLIRTVRHNPEIPFSVDRGTIPPGHTARAVLVVSRGDLRVPDAAYLVGNFHGLGDANTFPDIIRFIK